MHEPAQPLAAENVLLTVVGQDRVGIIARIATVLAENKINILDLNQKIVQGYFVMTLMADVSQSKIDMETLSRTMNDLGEELGLKIISQHESIFRSMHRI